MRAARVFIDSNTLVYALDESEPAKRIASRRWLAELVSRGCGVTNLLVLNEATNVLLRKSARFPNVNVFSRIDEFASLGTSSISWQTSLMAREIRKKSGYSWWDSLLLASALELRCTHFLSEDLQDGQTVDGLTIVDPFSKNPRDVLSG